MNRFRLLNDIVNTQYNDLKGLISIDFHNNIIDLIKLCDDNNINIKNYFPIGFGFMNHNDNIIMCKVLIIDKTKYGNTYDEIMTHTKNLNTIDVISKTFEIKFSDLMRYIKRLNCVGLSNICDNFKSINIEYQ